MNTKNTLPEGYRPYGKLTLCSNLLIGGGHLIQVGEMLPLLVGSGEIPKVWLQAPTDPSGKNFIQLVVASVATHPAVLVSVIGGILNVSAGGKKVLQVRGVGPDEAAVELLDLRPVGFNIFGDKNGLSAGGMQMSGNTVSGGGTFLALGGA
jgi:hypothetical protein